MQAHSPMVQLQFMASITRVLRQDAWFMSCMYHAV